MSGKSNSFITTWKNQRKEKKGKKKKEKNTHNASTRIFGKRFAEVRPTAAYLVKNNVVGPHHCNPASSLG